MTRRKGVMLWRLYIRRHTIEWFGVNHNYTLWPHYEKRDRED